MFYHKETSQLINIEKNDWFLYGDGGDIGLSVANYRQITEVGKETKITTQFFCDHLQPYHFSDVGQTFKSCLMWCFWILIEITRDIFSEI